MVKPLRIIQVSNPGSGSTVLVNLLMAYFQPYESVTFMGKNFYKEDILINNIVIKTHDKKINEWINRYKEIYDLYFIISDRNDYDWGEFYNYNNILFIQYNDILETESNTIENISKNVYEKIKIFLPDEFMIYNRNKVSIQNGINRINNMNKRYKEIKDKPFEFVDKYYQIHGNHRNKNHDESKKIRSLRK